MDPAAWEDWLDAINAIVGNPVNEPGIVHPMIEHGGKTFTSLQAYNSMRKFVGAYADRISSTELPSFLKELEITEIGEVRNPTWWKRWVKSVNETLQDEQIHFMHLFKKHLEK